MKEASREQEIRDRIEAGFGDWGRRMIRFRWQVIAAMALVTLVLASGMAELRFETSTDRFLDANDPARVIYDDFRRQFVNDDTIVVLVRGEDVFSMPFLERLRALHLDLENEIPLLDEVTSLVNARVTRGDADELIVEELLEAWPGDEEALTRAARRARSNPIYVNTLLSRDGHYTTLTINVTPKTQGSDEEALAGFDDGEAVDSSAQESVPPLPPVLMNEDLDSVMQSLQSVIERHRAEDFPIWVTGNPEMTWALANTMMKSLPLFTGLASLFIIALLSLFFRRISGVVLPLTMVVLPLSATLGIMGLTGLAISTATQQIPTFLLAVCIGDSIHILTVFYRRLDQGMNKRDAIVAALEHSGLAVMMTTLTTAVGLGSFIFADLAPLAELGVAAPVGVLLAFAYCVVLLPALLAVLPITSHAGNSNPKPSPSDRLLARLGTIASSHPWPVVGTWGLVLGVSIWGAAQLEIAHRPLEWFPEDHPTRVSALRTNAALEGFMPLEVIIDTGVANGLYEPEVLRRIDAVEQFARSVNVNGIKVGQAISLVDILKETHQALNANDPAHYAVPDTRELVAQELLLFENSGSDDLTELVDSQYQKARVQLFVTYHDGLLYLDLVRALNEGSREIMGSHADIQTTGLVELWLRTIDAMLASTFRSYSIALAVIAPLMILLIGSVRLGLLSLIPNLTPIIIGMAVMAGLGIHFDMFTMMIGTITIGIAVDDTIHFMHGFRRRYRAGASATEAVQGTLLTTGRALLVTSLVLCAGFAVQIFGDMQGTRNVGLITAVTIMAALLADIVLSPALVTLATRGAERRRL
ncbi:MAG: MMPL family transporter [bacterium]|nr:MMPL family transporter [bacterium]